jgi:hypothetical protein
MIDWTPGLTLEKVEKLVITKALEFYRGNKKQTAESLGISIRTIDNKMEQYAGEAEELQRREQANEEAAKARALSARGIFAQPVTKTQSEHDVPVRESEEVQKVLPKQHAPLPSGRHTRKA